MSCHLAMLDVLVTRDSTGSLSFQVYRKPTHTNQYLNFSSHYPLQHKLGVVRTLVDRANAIVTKQDERLHEISGIRKSLAICTVGTRIGPVIQLIAGTTVINAVVATRTLTILTKGVSLYHMYVKTYLYFLEIPTLDISLILIY